MKALAILGAVGRCGGTEFTELTVDHMLVRSAMLDLPAPLFNPRSELLHGNVLVHVEAFSCNYRDKGILARMQRAHSGTFTVIGSEFAATVVEVADGVGTLRPGDRVIGQYEYRGVVPGQAMSRQGIATNQASKEYFAVPEQRLACIPDNMPVATAASFTLGAQTAYSMIRRAGVQSGAHVLVTSGTSNTSLFLIQALSIAGARTTVTTSSTTAAEQLYRAGAERVIHVGGTYVAFGHSAELNVRVNEIGGFEAVFDPFFDTHLEKAINTLRPFGAYFTCGLSSNAPTVSGAGTIPQAAMHRVMVGALMNNISIVGNCLGLRSDLERALDDYSAARLRVIVDSVYDESDTAAFLDRTYNARDRFGKVVCRYTTR